MLGNHSVNMSKRRVIMDDEDDDPVYNHPSTNQSSYTRLNDNNCDSNDMATKQCPTWRKIILDNEDEKVDYAAADITTNAMQLDTDTTEDAEGKNNDKITLSVAVMM